MAYAGKYVQTLNFIIVRMWFVWQVGANSTHFGLFISYLFYWLSLHPYKHSHLFHVIILGYSAPTPVFLSSSFTAQLIFFLFVLLPQNKVCNSFCFVQPFFFLWGFWMKSCVLFLSNQKALTILYIVKLSLKQCNKDKLTCIYSSWSIK